jgi:ribokinase
MKKARMASGRIISVGGLYTDIVMVVDEMPETGEYVYGDDIRFIPGGNGLNVATAASRLEAPVQAVGFIGNDSLGASLIGFLKAEDIDTSKITKLKNASSGMIVYLLTGKVERHFAFTGSNMKASVKDVPEIRISSSDIVTSQLAIPHEIIMYIFKNARKSGARTILNLFPNYDVSKELLKLSDYVILNEVELAFRTGDIEFVKAQHKDLHMTKEEIIRRVKRLRTGGSQTVIVTLAERGVAGIIGDSFTAVDGIKVNLVDATGAGDCFLGAFATALHEGRNFRDVLRFANCAAAISVQKIGASSSYPSRNEVDSLLKKQR